MLVLTNLNIGDKGVLVLRTDTFGGAELLKTILNSAPNHCLFFHRSYSRHRFDKTFGYEPHPIYLPITFDTSTSK